MALYKITYDVTSGELPITVTLYSGSTTGATIDSNEHSSYEQGVFEYLELGDYVIYGVDSLGCYVEIPAMVGTTPTPTPTVTNTPTVTPTITPSIICNLSYSNVTSDLMTTPTPTPTVSITPTITPTPTSTPLPGDLLLEFQTNINGTFDPAITASSGTYGWDYDGTYYTGNSLNIGNDGTTRTVKLYGNGTQNITSIDVNNDGVIGSFNISNAAFETLTSINLNNNSGLSSLTMPSTTGTFTYFDINQCSSLTGNLDLSSIDTVSNCIFKLGAVQLSGWTFASSITGTMQEINNNYTNTTFTSSLDLTMFDSWTSGATINISGLDNLPSVTFATGLTGTFTSFYINGGNFSTIDLSMFTDFTDEASFTVQQLSSTPTITFPTISTGSFNYFVWTDIANSSVDLSTYTLAGSVYYSFGSNNVTTYTAPVVDSGATIGTYYLVLGSGYNTVLDLTSLTTWSTSATLNIQCYGITGINFGTMVSGNFIQFRIAYAYNITNLSLSGLTSTAFNRDNCSVQVYFCNLSDAAEVNQLFVEIDAACSSGNSNRSANISAGTTVAPDSSSGGYNGTAAVSSLEGKGFTVTTA